MAWSCIELYWSTPWSKKAGQDFSQKFWSLLPLTACQLHFCAIVVTGSCVLWRVLVKPLRINKWQYSMAEETKKTILGCSHKIICYIMRKLVHPLTRETPLLLSNYSKILLLFPPTVPSFGWVLVVQSWQGTAVCQKAFWEIQEITVLPQNKTY